MKHVPTECRDTQCATHGVAALHIRATLGRRTEIARSGSRMSETRTDAYGYNMRDELVSASKLGGSASVPTVTEYSYQYDDIGNRITSLDLGTNRVYSANELNQYSSITTLTSDAGLQTSGFEPQFDLDGNQTLIQTSTGVWQVQYNAENRPVLWTCLQPNNQTITTNQTISMLFDRMGRRVEYVETTDFHNQRTPPLCTTEALRVMSECCFTNVPDGIGEVVDKNYSKLGNFINPVHLAVQLERDGGIDLRWAQMLRARKIEL